MTTIVIYATKKGSSEIYAREFANSRHYPILEQAQVTSKGLITARNIYYFGSVYAGKVLGLEEWKKKIDDKKEMTIVSVGLSSKNDQEKLAEIQKGISEDFPEAATVHLRGRLVIEQMKLPEKLIVKMISMASKKKIEQEKFDIEKAIEQVVDVSCVDFIDLAELDRII
ncbi:MULTISPECIES: flavodoxin domain-containing protein [Enterococcus]|uniref:flavodoxin domain-containing protein n=1 Tax=Enterococcus TaxID=1350 RepID=UPI000EC3DA43|nr:MULTISPECIES: flavodoxin domain-containing protein [Enterococcus]HCM87964.1 hypothetical protein [Enterococcus sp.]